MKLLGMKDIIKFNESGEEFVVEGIGRQGIQLVGKGGNRQKLSCHDFETLLAKEKIEVQGK